jgi:hypothetical protein
VLGLEWFALWLERSPLQVAWPVLFAFVFQVFLFAVHVLQWLSRRMFLRVACDYPVTTTKGSKPCKNRALGEWHRCHKHGRQWQRRTDHHMVDPDLPRWQTIERGVRRERQDRYGEGSLRARSRSIGLLYHCRYARRPTEVKRLIPEVIKDYRSRWRELHEQFRQWRSGQRVNSESVVRQSGVAAEVAIIREATRGRVGSCRLRTRLRRPCAHPSAESDSGHHASDCRRVLRRAAVPPRRLGHPPRHLG